jgi:hypothetical protein
MHRDMFGEIVVESRSANPNKIYESKSEVQNRIINTPGFRKSWLCSIAAKCERRFSGMGLFIMVKNNLLQAGLLHIIFQRGYYLIQLGLP